MILATTFIGKMATENDNCWSRTECSIASQKHECTEQLESLQMCINKRLTLQISEQRQKQIKKESKRLYYLLAMWFRSLQCEYIAA